MDSVQGKVAFITGGASGIGLGMAEAFLEAGVKVAIADVDKPNLAKVLTRLRKKGDIIGVDCDVTDEKSVDVAAETVVAAFGKVHIVCSNAGVNPMGKLNDIRPVDWRWVFDVNVMGIVNGIRTFMPIILGQGEGGHFVHTCSAVGLAFPPIANGSFAPYLASKYAAVGLSEKLAVELAPEGVGVSMLCPSFVRTNLTASERLRPDRFAIDGAAAASEQDLAKHRALLGGGMDPLEIGRRTLRAIRNNDLYIVPHPNIRADVERRFKAILAAFDNQAEDATRTS